MGASAVISEISMGEGQVLKKVRRGTGSLFSTAREDIDCLGGAPANGCIVDREEGYVN